MTPPRLLSVLAALVLAAGCPHADAQDGSSPMQPRIQTAAGGPVGVVRPSREVVLKAPTPGILAEVLVAEGQRVEAGKLLARVDDRVQAARVEAAKMRADATAEAEELAAAADATRRELNRTRGAAATGAAPAWELEAAETAVTVAEARHAAALQRSRLAAAELAVEKALLDRHRMTAPFDAVVLSVEADAGASLTPADAVLRLAALDPLEATVHVPAAHHRRLGPRSLGTGVRLRPTLPDTPTLDAVLHASLPEIDPGSRSFRCVFRIDNPGWELPAGFTVELEVPGPEQASR